jgi:hypothetical protein
LPRPHERAAIIKGTWALDAVAVLTIADGAAEVVLDEERFYLVAVYVTFICLLVTAISDDPEVKVLASLSVSLYPERLMLCLRALVCSD